MFSTKRRAALAAAVAMPSLLLSSCGPKLDGPGAGGDGTPIADPDASGSVVVSGSSTVEPITAWVREEFIAQNANVEISVDGPGTGDGFELFCDGEIDIADASRPIKAEEIEVCEANGVEFVELKVGIDGLTVVVNESNPLECLSFQDLYALVGPESEGTDRWSDAAELAGLLGSSTPLPDENLVVNAPGTESGTFDSFVELVIEHAGEPRVEAGEISEDEVAGARDDYTPSPDDNAVIESAQVEPGGLGWVGFAYADQAEGVKLMPIAEEPDGECIAPTAESIQDTSYPIARDLFIYVNAAKAEEGSAVDAFVDFYLGGLASFVELADFVPLADDRETQAAWAERLTGTRVGSDA